jgi:hypothetical protein
MLHDSRNWGMEKKTNHDGVAKNVRLQQLQDEIDKLALLVNQAKVQSDKIQAVADALGDAVFVNLEPGILPETGSDKRNRLRKSD